MAKLANNSHPVTSDLYTLSDLIMIRDYPHLLGHICGYMDLTELHSFWIQYCFNSTEHTTLLAHRGSMKTSAMEVGVINYLLWHPNGRLMYMRRSFTEALGIVENICKMMEKPEVRELFRFAHGEPWKYTKRNQQGVDFSFRKKPSKDVSLFPRGCEGGITGTHCSKAVADDVVNLTSRYSEAERVKIELIMRDVYTSVIDPGHYVSLVGTRYHRNDYFSVAPKGLSFNVYDTKLLNADQIEEKRRTETNIGFMAQYMLEITTPEGAAFAEIKETTFSFKDCEPPRAQIDAAFGAKDYCALTIMARRKDGTIQAVGFCSKVPIVEWIPFIREKLRLFHCKTVYVEMQGDKGWSASMLRSEGLIVKPYNETMNKVNKISTYLGEIWPKLYYDTTVSDVAYLDMISTWEPDTKEYDDAPDSAASLARECYTSMKANKMNRWS